MTIAITTPRGHVGSHVLQRLVQAGAFPRVLMRDPGVLDPVWHGHVDAVACDEKRHGAGEIDGLARTEEALDATGASVLHLRAGYFFSNLLMDLDALREGVLRTTNPLDAPMPWVDPRDIAEVAAGRLLHPWEGRGATAVHGPEDLTFAQVADVLTTALGHPVRAERIADDDLRASLGAVGLGEAQVEAIVGMSTGLRDGFVPEQPRSVLTTTPSTLAGWAHAHLRPLL